MKGKTGPAATLLRPVLDTYMDSAVALVGCTSRGLGRYSCEFDVLVVTKEMRPSTSLKIGDVYADITFVTEKEILKPTSPEKALSLALANPIRDTSLILSTSIATNLATISISAQAASRIRLASALKTIVRAEEAMAKGSLTDADFWTLAASYEFAYAFLLSEETLPSPSHLLSQLRSGSRGTPRSFEGISLGAGLEAAGRAGCGARLEGIAILHDLLRERSTGTGVDPGWSPVRTEILTVKARELMTRMELAECYSFLGQELVDDMLTLLRLHPKRTLGSLISGESRLIGERLVRQLGLARGDKTIKTSLNTLKLQVGQLSKKT